MLSKEKLLKRVSKARLPMATKALSITQKTFAWGCQIPLYFCRLRTHNGIGHHGLPPTL